LAAAKKTERRWLGIELDARYFEIARTRLQTDEPAAA
jgi:DNA modification methylase